MRESVRKAAQPRRRVLVISAEENEHSSLHRILDPAGWEFQAAITERIGMDALRRDSHDIPVVICNYTLPDGDWKRIWPLRMKYRLGPTWLCLRGWPTNAFGRRC